MKAKFVGDPNDDGSGPKVCRMGYGPSGKPTLVYFPRDKFVGVPAQLEEMIAGHNHFETEEGVAELYVPSDDDVPRAKRDPLDHDSSGKKGGSLSKVETLRRLEALQAEHPELSFDPKATLPALRGILEDAEFEYDDGGE